MEEKQYLCIDLKSFYASVECVELGLDPMTTNLVVADPERSEKTICLAVSPSMKALGVKNRCRVFEIPKQIPYIMAEPRMKKYVEYAARIYEIYLSYLAPEDIHVYSIDEAFLDVTLYLPYYQKSSKELALQIMSDIEKKVGVRAACGIGTNLYLAKIALDSTAKHNADFIGILDEESYKRTMWDHKPLRDFWRIGKRTEDKLAQYGIRTMGDIAAADQAFLYQLFGVDAELLIDHAWGREPVTIGDIKAYHSKTNSLTSGQVLMRDYSFGEGELIAKEMMDMLCLEMADKGLTATSVTLHVGYSNSLHAESARGTASFAAPTNADAVMIPAIVTLYRRIVDPNYPVRRFHLTCNHVEPEGPRQMSLFEDQTELEKQRKVRHAVLDIKKKYGKNAIMKGMNLEEGATARERNRQIGGHKSGQ